MNKGFQTTTKEQTMLETLRVIEDATVRADLLDKVLIQDRREPIRRNLSQIQGLQRSEKYVARAAGFSDDKPRKSKTQNYLEWFGGAAIEDPIGSAKVQAFWMPLFQYSNPAVVWSPVKFWEAYEAVNVLMARTGKAWGDFDTNEVRFNLIVIKHKIDDMLKMAEVVPEYTRVG